MPGKNNRPEWLTAIYGLVRCPACNHRYKAEEMRLTATLEPAPPGWPEESYVVACVCARCGQRANCRVPGEYVRLREPQVPALTVDDVLDAHDALAKVKFAKEVLR